MPRANMLPALGPPTLDSPKVASMSESASADRYTPNNEPSESGEPSEFASGGVIVVNETVIGSPLRSMPSSTVVPTGTVVSSSRSAV